VRLFWRSHLGHSARDPAGIVAVRIRFRDPAILGLDSMLHLLPVITAVALSAVDALRVAV
jgi:hypothetical protein